MSAGNNAMLVQQERNIRYMITEMRECSLLPLVELWEKSWNSSEVDVSVIEGLIAKQIKSIRELEAVADKISEITIDEVPF